MRNTSEFVIDYIKKNYIIVDPELGIVFRTRGNSGRPIDPVEVKGSDYLGKYRKVTIREGDERIIITLHKIIYIAKHGYVPDEAVIHHINGNTRDNRIKNLAMISREENSRRAWKDGLHKNNYKKAVAQN